MSQDIVMGYLRRHKGWNTTAQISAGTGIGHRSVNASLSVLHRYRMVEYVKRTVRSELWHNGVLTMHTSPLPIYRMIKRSAHEHL